VAEEFEADPVGVEGEDGYGDREREQVAVVHVALQGVQEADALGASSTSSTRKRSFPRCTAVEKQQQLGEDHHVPARASRQVVSDRAISQRPDDSQRRERAR
jgi:hypothetical protein